LAINEQEDSSKLFEWLIDKTDVRLNEIDGRLIA